MKLYNSTRSDLEKISAPEAVLRGIAPDGGLYIRNEAPLLPPQELAGADFLTLAKRILGAYLSGYTQEEIDCCVEDAYRGKFEAENIVPIQKVGGQYVLELFHGPTAAFKDVALSILPRLMRCAMEKAGRTDEIMILTATSGDTGSAALTGFQNVEGTRIVVFYPDQGISPIQRRQMIAMEGKNISVCAINGNFDDAQTGVKHIFREMPSAFLAENGISLSSANSINIGRLAPQIVYYYSAYLDLVRAGEIQMGEKVNFCVPTGNFGDILAGYFAYLSGLPIGKLICASNANNVLTDFLSDGVYDKNRAFLTTISPSMDILVSSNLERLLYLAMDQNPQAVAEKMRALQETGRYRMDEKTMAKIRLHFAGACASDEEARDAIGRVFAQHSYLMDPHTAVAWKCMEDYRRDSGDDAPCVVLSTASPYKFPQSVLHALGASIPESAQRQMEALEQLTHTSAPQALRGVMERKVRFEDCIDPSEMMAYVQKKAVQKL